MWRDPKKPDDSREPWDDPPDEVFDLPTLESEDESTIRNLGIDSIASTNRLNGPSSHALSSLQDQPTLPKQRQEKPELDWADSEELTEIQHQKPFEARGHPPPTLPSPHAFP